MSTHTAVDLSRLPAPDIVEALSYGVILSAMLGDLRELDPQFTALVESDPLYKILQVCAYRELGIRQRVNDASRAGMLAYARGADLDHLGALLDVGRYLLSPGIPAEGIDPTYESDADFRRRIQLAPEGFSVAGPDGAYIYHSLAADPAVLDASASSPTPGEVVVTVLARHDNGEANPELLAAVAASLSSDRVRPMTDHVTVQTAEIVPYEVVARIYTYDGPDSSLVLADSIARLRAYIDSSHRLGRDIPLSGIYAALHTEGVQSVDIDLPTADLVISRQQAPHCSLINVTHGGINE